MPHQLHKLAMQFLNSEREQSLVKVLEKDEKALIHYNSVKGYGAIAYAQAIPTNGFPTLRLSSVEFAASVSFALYMDSPFNQPSHCVCGEKLDLKGIHLASCSRGHGNIKVHNMVCELVKKFARAAERSCSNANAGIIQNLNPDSRIVADGVIHEKDFNGFPIVFDCVITNPICQTNMNRRFRNVPLNAALGSEQDKIDKHGPGVVAAGMLFKPFCWEWIGAFGPTFRNLFEEFLPQIHGYEAPNWRAPSPRSFYTQSFSVVINKYHVRKQVNLLEMCRRVRPMHSKSYSPLCPLVSFPVCEFSKVKQSSQVVSYSNIIVL